MNTIIRLSNPTVAAVASNNIAAIRKDKDISDAWKRLRAIDDAVLSDKLNAEQQEAVLGNRALALCLLGKVRNRAQHL